MSRRSLPAALAAAGLLATPAAASADATILAGPIKAKGYSINLTATDAATDTFGVIATKSAGASRQMHIWSFTGVKVTVRGGTATIKGNLAGYGSVNARISARARTKGTVPAGCKGTPGTVRSGRLTGRTLLVLDSTFFRTLAVRSTKAQIVRNGRLDCSATAAPQRKGLMLTSSAGTPRGQLTLSVLKDGSKVTQQVMHSDTVAGKRASVMHMITAPAGDAGLRAAADLSTATVAAAGRFLTGALSFTGEPLGTMATGTVSGAFTAKFDSIAPQTLPEGNAAMLMQR